MIQNRSKMIRIQFFLTFAAILVKPGLCELWCYQCVSTQPGCTEFEVDWYIHHAVTCPRDDDKCVKIIERKGGDTRITRDCLSSFAGLRTDIPADHYDGCRPAAKHPKLAVYVENEISQHDLQRNYWDEITYCFCDFDQWCNGSQTLMISPVLLFIMILVLRHVL